MGEEKFPQKYTVKIGSKVYSFWRKTLKIVHMDSLESMLVKPVFYFLPAFFHFLVKLAEKLWRNQKYSRQKVSSLPKA